MLKDRAIAIPIAPKLETNTKDDNINTNNEISLLYA